LNLLVEFLCVLIRRHPKLFLQHRCALFVLPERGGTLPRQTVESHQKAVDRLVEGIYRKPDTSVIDSWLELTSGAVNLHQTLEDKDVLLLEALLLEELPFVKVGAVFEVKTGKKLATVKMGGLDEQFDDFRLGPFPIRFPTLLY
jgi:hypothetical protein